MTFQDHVCHELREIGRVIGRDMSRAIAEVTNNPADYSESCGMTVSDAASLAMEVAAVQPQAGVS